MPFKNICSTKLIKTQDQATSKAPSPSLVISVNPQVNPSSPSFSLFLPAPRALPSCPLVGCVVSCRLLCALLRAPCACALPTPCNTKQHPQLPLHNPNPVRRDPAKHLKFRRGEKSSGALPDPSSSAQRKTKRSVFLLPGKVSPHQNCSTLRPRHSPLGLGQLLPLFFTSLCENKHAAVLPK